MQDKKLVEIVARAICGHDMVWEAYLDDALAVLTAIKEAGYAVVPREPTEAMKRAGDAALVSWVAPAMHSADAYRAIITAGEE